MTDTNIPANNFTGPVELLASQGAAACADSDSDNKAPSCKRLRPNHSSSSPDYILRFTQGAIGQKYVVIKGIKPGIYSDW